MRNIYAPKNVSILEQRSAATTTLVALLAKADAVLRKTLRDENMMEVKTELRWACGLLAWLLIGCSESSKDTSADGGAAPDSGPGPPGPCDLGELPAPLAAELRLPALPTISQEREVASATELEQAAAEAGTRVIVGGTIDERVTLRGSDVEVTFSDPTATVRSLTIGQSVQRVLLSGGHYGTISTPLPADYHPELVYRPEYFTEDITFDGVLVDSTLDPDQDQALSLRGKRIAVYNSTIRAEAYSVWSGDAGPFQTEDLVLACSTFRSHAPAGNRNEATVRFVSVLRSAVVDNVLQNSNESSFDESVDDPFSVDPASNTKHNYRIHGHSDLNYAARNLLINSGMMFGGLEDGFADPPLDHIGRMWVNDNTFHHRVPDMFNPKETIDALVAHGNVAYTLVWGQFYGGTPAAGWEVSDNQVLPYEPPPDGFLD